MTETKEEPIKDIFGQPLKEGFYLYSQESYKTNKGTVFLKYNEKEELVREWSDGYQEIVLPNQVSTYEPLLDEHVKAKINGLKEEVKWFESNLEKISKKR